MSISKKGEKPLSDLRVPDSHQEGEGIIGLYLDIAF